MERDETSHKDGVAEQPERAVPLFQGEYTHSLDAKGRLTIPVCFRDVLAQGMQITRGYEPCIVVYTLAEWDALAAKTARLPSSSAEVRDNNRFVFAGGVKVQPDGMGRILLPDYLRRHAHIDGQAVLLGLNDKLEIWNPEEWQVRLAKIMANINEINAETARLGM